MGNPSLRLFAVLLSNKHRSKYKGDFNCLKENLIFNSNVKLRSTVCQLVLVELYTRDRRVLGASYLPSFLC